MSQSQSPKQITQNDEILEVLIAFRQEFKTFAKDTSQRLSRLESNITPKPNDIHTSVSRVARVKRSVTDTVREYSENA